jgi:hypothetical protein
MTRYDGVEKPLKKSHTRLGGPGNRTRDLPRATSRARRLATTLGGALSCTILLNTRPLTNSIESPRPQ